MTAETDVVRQFMDAYNARDVDRFLALATDDIEIRNPLGNAVHGIEGAREFLSKNEQMGVLVQQDGRARIDGNQIAIPAVMRLRSGTELRSAGVFEVRDGRVARLWILTDRAAAGL
jgi:hypothetical protein